MGRLDLTAINVRRTVLATSQALKRKSTPKWTSIIGEVPPAQILIRQQPAQHALTKVRTRTRPDGKTEQYVQTLAPKKPKSAKGRHLFTPTTLRYEEDSLRRRFFSDHPWELARPRVVVETSGDQHQHADWSTGLVQPGIPLSGESVVQRQLWLLENVPDITLPQAYDMARKEFYTLRRQEETRNRIAAEEARHMGAQFGKSAVQISMGIENEAYNDWERWARKAVSEQTLRAAAFEGSTVSTEEPALKDVAEDQGQISRPPIGAGVFAQQQQHDSRSQRRQPA